MKTCFYGGSSCIRTTMGERQAKMAYSVDQIEWNIGCTGTGKPSMKCRLGPECKGF